MAYDRNKATAYAHKWAMSRNENYYDFSRIGGDCTNFISQCLYAGCGVMNYTRDTGWYYNAVNSRSPSWAGVEFLYNFLTENKGGGPYGSEQPLRKAELGDIIQLSFDGKVFRHSLLVVETTPQILISTHSYDNDNRALKTYIYQKARLIHIDGSRG
ncbi:MAG: amidase domain-containing protein [Clostridiales bacterium]|jgi:hypothetical protein|nr:amidase domain-containing protein [Clostridiales bacterium]